MARQAAPADRFRWQLSVWAVVCTTILFVPLVIWNIDFGLILYFLFASIAILVELIITIVLANRTRHRRWLSFLAMIVATCATSSLLFTNAFFIHTRGHWITQGSQSSAAVLAQPTPSAGDLKHVEWDGWGWGGNDTTVYLVFDPIDSLASAAKNHASGRISSALCGISRMQRLEKNWYSVVFYTNDAWGDCS
jgi:hypothetical protein